jgi:hypothetical protein
MTAKAIINLYLVDSTSEDRQQLAEVSMCTGPMTEQTELIKLDLYQGCYDQKVIPAEGAHDCPGVHAHANGDDSESGGTPYPAEH